MGDRKPCRIRLLPAGLTLLLAFPCTASAHLSVQGVGEIASGALHPLMTPAHVLILLGLALMLGQKSPLDLKLPMLVFAPASALALGLTTTGSIGEVHPSFLIGLAMGMAILVAMAKCPSQHVIAGLCAAAAIGIGLDSGVETGSMLASAKTLLGTWVALNAIVGYAAICVSHGASREWSRIGVRVAASWIIAISLMVLAFSLRK